MNVSRYWCTYVVVMSSTIINEWDTSPYSSFSNVLTLIGFNPLKHVTWGNKKKWVPHTYKISHYYEAISLFTVPPPFSEKKRYLFYRSTTTDRQSPSSWPSVILGSYCSYLSNVCVHLLTNEVLPESFRTVKENFLPGSSQETSILTVRNTPLLSSFFWFVNSY